MSGHKPFSELLERMGPNARRRVAQKAAALRAEMPLYDLRAALELSQQQLADVLDIDQPAVSRIERRADMMLSTLARFVEAMGGTLEVRAAFPEGIVRIAGLAQMRRWEKATDESRRAARSVRAKVKREVPTV